MNGLDILEHAGDEYRRLVNGAKWTLASLNYAPRFDEKNIVDLERHNLTDETFVLLQGEATLLLCQGEDALATGKGAKQCGQGVLALAERKINPVRIPLSPLKYYNVRAGIWHNIIVSKDARVLVAENANTSKDNTDYLDLKTGRVFQKRPTFEEVLPDTYLLKVPFGPVWTGVVLVRGRRQGEDALATGEGDVAHCQGEDALATGEGAKQCGQGVPALAERNRNVNVLIDSSHLEPEKYLLPALADLGLAPSDIDWLLNTHVHGDHIGGHHALVTKYGLKTATLASAADALRDPVKVAVRVRTRFPKNSPAPQSYLKGVEPDRLLAEGELLEGRFRAIATPGHDDDCLTWIDTKTGTAFTGDSLQANGTSCQGVAFYRSLPDYRATLAKLGAEKLSNIVCGHVYDGIGDVIRGAEAVRTALDYCGERVALYGARLREYLCQGEDALATGEGDVARCQGEDALATGEGDVARCQGEDALATEDGAEHCSQDVLALAPGKVEDESVLVPLALKLIGEVGCGMPESLFLALHTVSEHLKELSAQ